MFEDAPAFQVEENLRRQACGRHAGLNNGQDFVHGYSRKIGGSTPAILL
jgi:hypothetical protein